MAMRVCRISSFPCVIISPWEVAQTFIQFCIIVSWYLDIRRRGKTEEGWSRTKGGMEEKAWAWRTVGRDERKKG